jgi:hypothetical protein
MSGPINPGYYLETNGHVFCSPKDLYTGPFVLATPNWMTRFFLRRVAELLSKPTREAYLMVRRDSGLVLVETPDNPWNFVHFQQHVEPALPVLFPNWRTRYPDIPCGRLPPWLTEPVV